VGLPPSIVWCSFHRAADKLCITGNRRCQCSLGKVGSGRACPRPSSVTHFTAQPINFA
jgi:hypothetical protein